MCGITGIYAFNELGRFHSIKLSQATQTLARRGPDAGNMSLHHFVNLGHRRLSIIDLSSEANQPMRDELGRYTIVFNGEIFNFLEIKAKLQAKGIEFQTNSDTEVLLKSFILYGATCLHELNGFFALAIYDEETEELFLARDRYGVKPLLVYEDEDKVIFGSEMKALMSFGIEKKIDFTSLHQYLQFNYIPAPATIFKNVRKLRPGYYLKIQKRKVIETCWYKIPQSSIGEDLQSSSQTLDYQAQQQKLLELLEHAVQRRLIADVPFGAFLSGGIDSSVITALASRHTDKLNTFSIGFRDEKFFDETQYANLVAQKFNTNHTVFSLSNQDLFDHLFEVLDYIDEPFADSSALAVYVLSKQTRKKVTVALSGDGADELFSGYNKHSAEYQMRNGNWKTNAVKALLPLWNVLPKSRNNFLTNKFRQFQRFGEAMNLSAKERYWQWATFAKKDEAASLFSQKIKNELDKNDFENRKTEILQFIDNDRTDLDAFNQVLHTDLHLVLESDMLTKVDLMSMANSLEVRTPFLDYEVVDFVAQLPVSSKINANIRKRLLQDTFKDILPAELYNRPKKGFEVPLLKWLRKDLKDMIENDLLSDNFIESQGIFDVSEIRKLKQKLFSSNPEDTHARIWGLLVFQYWFKKWGIGTESK